MHEFKHGELRSGRQGKGSRVKNRRQAIAIAPKEVGNSRYESDRKNRRDLARTDGSRSTSCSGLPETTIDLQ